MLLLAVVAAPPVGVTPWLVPSLIGVMTCLIGTTGGYLVARRTTKGSVGTSEAATIWEAAEKIRQELRADVVSLRRECAELRERETDLQRQISTLRSEMVALRLRFGDG